MTMTWLAMYTTKMMAMIRYRSASGLKSRAMAVLANLRLPKSAVSTSMCLTMDAALCQMEMLKPLSLLLMMR